MPHRNYLPDRMGSAISQGPARTVAGEFDTIPILYRAGPFGIDEGGSIRLVWRSTSDFGPPQFSNPNQANYTAVLLAGGGRVQLHFDPRQNIRPWSNTLLIRFLSSVAPGEEVRIVLGERGAGSPGIRMQTCAEPSFEFKLLVDAFGTGEYSEIETNLVLDVAPGTVSQWRLAMPTLLTPGDAFRLAIVPEDKWGNPTADVDTDIRLQSSRPVTNLPAALHVDAASVPIVLTGLRVHDVGPLLIELIDRPGRAPAAISPALVEAGAASTYWGDLHGQSEETVGTNSAEDYMRFARDRAFVDIVGHQGNDMQITDEFWADLNDLMGKYNDPGRFITIPGYEWSGNTGVGGDRNVFYFTEHEPIIRSSRILVADADHDNAYHVDDLFTALRDADAVVIAHVGGRYADLAVGHDARLETAVEVHSSWGTFEWILFDAFRLGHRVGIVCHSDDHKGRPGATQPGAHHFGAIGGLTCYLSGELTRRAIRDTLRRRHHYGTTGTRIFLSVEGRFEADVTQFETDPMLGPTVARQVRDVTMGDIVCPGDTPMRMTARVIGSAPLHRVDVFQGATVAARFRPFRAEAAGQRIRVIWSGAESRGRGRATSWEGSARVQDNVIESVSAINFLNKARPLQVSPDGQSVAWHSVTTGNQAGFDLVVREVGAGALVIATNHINITIDLADVTADGAVFPCGGIEKQVRIDALPRINRTHEMTIEHLVTRSGAADLPVFVRVTQEDGHQAWSSPIYLIGPPLSAP